MWVPSISYEWLLDADDIIKYEKNGLMVKLKGRYKYTKGIEEDITNLADAICNLIEDEKNLQRGSKNYFIKRY